MLSREELSNFAEYVYNGESIDWDYWASLTNITPAQGARLAHHIDPIRHADKYGPGDMPKELQIKISRLEQWLASISPQWTLDKLANALGLDNLPFDMAEAVKKQRIDEANKNSFDTEPLEPLSNEQKQDYYSLAAWSWVDAIYILQGYKPAYQISTELVRSHFPAKVKYFTDSLLLGAIGKEINQAGEKSFIDSPANWQAFWQSIDNKPEPKAEAVDGGKVVLTKNQRRDADFQQWQHEEPSINLDEFDKDTIHEFLKQRDLNLWKTGFKDWWKQQNFYKAMPGRKPNKRR